MVHNADNFRAKTYDVFLSYKRENDDARAVLAKALEAMGYDVFWDAKLNHEDWKGQLRDEINRSAIVICLWSTKAATSENVRAEAFHAFGIKKLLSAYLDDASVVPDYFKNTNLHAFDGWADESRREAQIARILATLERVTGGPSHRTNLASAAAIIPVEWGDIPGAPPRLLGRDNEMHMLREAWESRPPRKVNAVLFHALGGAGKSALLRTFANELLSAGGCGAEFIYGWSAYSQGSGEQKRADADSFISKALGEFGFKGRPPSDPVERARELAKLVQRRRTLLLLDGLEPLQNHPAIDKGRFKDKAFAELVKMLASQNDGLVVLTSRLEIPEIEGYGSLVIKHELDRLSPSAGAELLIDLGVRGRQVELEDAVRGVAGHALSVTLLGTYISEVCGGDIRHREQFDFADILLTEAEEEELTTDKTIAPAKRAALVMRGYLERFDSLAAGAKDGLGQVERTLLHLLGLFDRPADGGAVEALLDAPIPGLTEALFHDTGVAAGRWPFKSRRVKKWALTPCERARRTRRAKEVLRRLRLLSAPNPDDPLEMDAHPIVRAFFSGRLEVTAPDAARAAHELLYRHYAHTASDLPDTLEAMQPLFHAVQHGVKGGWAQEALHELVHRRILRGGTSYLWRALGAFGQYLTTLSYFFDVPWRAPRPDLSLEEQAWLLGEAAHAIKSLGRLKDAIEPRLASIARFVELEHWDSAATLTNSLCQELLILGQVEKSVEAGYKSKEYSKLGENLVVRSYCLSDYGYAQLHFGEPDAAMASLRQVENLFGYKLHGFMGYKYGDLLLEVGEPEFVVALGKEQLPVSRYHREWGFDYLLIGRAQDLMDDPDATASLETAVVEFRAGAAIHHLPKALLARAAHHRRLAGRGQIELIAKVREDLAEVEGVAGGEMKLYLADLALERARLALDVPSAFASAEAARVEAEAQIARADDLIAETGYRRRQSALDALHLRLNTVSQPPLKR